MRKLLFGYESKCVQPLLALSKTMAHWRLVLWAFDVAPQFLAMYEAGFPNDTRPRDALIASEAWSRGEIKMPIAKAAILSAHSAATAAEPFPARQAAARAVGHAAATVHVGTHAMAVVFYGLTAIAYRAEDGYSVEPGASKQNAATNKACATEGQYSAKNPNITKENGAELCKGEISKRYPSFVLDACNNFFERMQYFAKIESDKSRKWARFLCDK